MARLPDAPHVASEVAPGIHRIVLPTSFPVGPVNSYLIDDDPLTLVDAGPNAATSLVALEDGLRSLGRRVEELELILVTHQHVDHTGLVGVVARRSGADVAGLKALGPWLEHYEGSIRAQQHHSDDLMVTHGVPRDVRLAIAAMSRRGFGWGASASITVPLAASRQLRLRDRTLSVFHRPGHSPSDTVFVDARHRTMIGGDHLLAHISSNAVVTPPLADGGHSRPRPLVDYRASLRATARDPVDIVLPGHGETVDDHPALIAQRLQSQDERRDRLHELIAARPRSAYELAEELFGERAITQAVLTLSEVLGHVDLLLDRGAVSETCGPDGIVRFAVAERTPQGV